MDEEYDILDTSQICYEGSFDNQVLELLKYVRLTRQEVENLNRLFDDLEGALRNVWPGCQVLPFGSIVTGLGIKTSDVDCYVQLPNDNQKKTLVVIAKKVLQKYPHIFQQVFAIVAAKVPIVKLYHAPTNMNCDVNFKSYSGVRNSKLLAYLLHLDHRAFNLAIIIKYWSKVHAITGTNLMPSYALTLLVIFYLQQEKVLPPIIQLQRNIPPEITDNWNTAFNDKTPYITYNKKPLYHLLGGFFKFYNSFKFSENIVSLYEGKALNKKDFENLISVSDTYNLYKENVVRHCCKQLRVDCYLCIQDPFEHSRNCAVAVFPKLANRIVECFRSASNLYEDKDSKDFLKAILLRKKIDEFLVKPKQFNRCKPISFNKPNETNRANSTTPFKRNRPNKKAVKNHFNILFEDLNRRRKGHS